MSEESKQADAYRIEQARALIHAHYVESGRQWALSYPIEDSAFFVAAIDVEAVESRPNHESEWAIEFYCAAVHVRDNNYIDPAEINALVEAMIGTATPEPYQAKAFIEGAKVGVDERLDAELADPTYLVERAKARMESPQWQRAAGFIIRARDRLMAAGVNPSDFVRPAVVSDKLEEAVKKGGRVVIVQGPKRKR